MRTRAEKQERCLTATALGASVRPAHTFLYDMEGRMKKLKRILRKLLFPGAAIVIFSALIGAGLLAYTFWLPARIPQLPMCPMRFLPMPW